MRKLTLKAIAPIMAAILGTIACLYSLSTMHAETLAASSPAINPAFSPVLPLLQQETSVPLRLPLYIPNDNQPLTIEILAASSTAYTLALDMGANCGGVTACTLGEIDGELITSSTPPLSGQAVKLNNGSKAYYTPPTCGANCTDSTLSVDISGYQYIVGIKGNGLPTLLKMMNSLQLIIPAPQPSPTAIPTSTPTPISSPTPQPSPTSTPRTHPTQSASSGPGS